MFEYHAADAIGILPIPYPDTMNGETDMVEEVVIVGQRVQRITRLDPNPGIYERSYNVWTGSGWQPLFPVDQYVLDAAIDAGTDVDPITEPEVTVLVPKTSPNYAKALNAALLIEQKVDELHQSIMIIENDEVIFLDNGNHMTGAQLKNLWNNIDYAVTEDAYDPGKGGEVVGNVSRVRFDTIYDPDAHKGYYVNAGDMGIGYYVLHELSHLTAPGKAKLDEKFLAYQSAVPGDQKGKNFYTHPLGLEVERFTNNIYQDIAPHVNQPVWLSAPAGF